MASPDLNTPITNLLNILGALPEWFVAHEGTLREELGDDAAALAARLLEVRAALDATQSDFVREQREDVATTAQRTQLRGDVGAFLVSLSSAIKLNYRDRAQQAVAFKDILPVPSSSLRNDNDQRKALIKAREGLRLHQGAFKGRGEARTLRAQALLEQADALAVLEAREAIETHKAREARDAAQAQALELFRVFSLAADAAADLSSAPATDLKTICDLHNPA